MAVWRRNVFAVYSKQALARAPARLSPAARGSHHLPFVCYIFPRHPHSDVRRHVWFTRFHQPVAADDER